MVRTPVQTNHMCDCPNRLHIDVVGTAETISLQGKTNFFEKRVEEYSKSGVGVDRANQIFALDTSF